MTRQASKKGQVHLLMCHAPIVIPEIAGARARECRASTQAMQAAAQAVVDRKPSLLVLVSPHAPRFEKSFGMFLSSPSPSREAELAREGSFKTPRLRGSFADFGSPELKIDLPAAADLGERFRLHALSSGIALEGLPPRSLDHGSLVPLYFLTQAGWDGPTLVFSFPEAPTEAETEKFGKCLRAFFEEHSFALIASGDMSHRLSPDAPGGFDPRARDFDEHVVQSLRAQDLARASTPDPELRERAGEDVIDSLLVLKGVLSPSARMNVLSYEAPFGVGYTIACGEGGLS